ncbi:MAG: 16S rRNA (cytidine(1402)-2'-O)-methyltransferase [Chloroflexi bacterium]|nr:16S rRNA (cytidine(1402)-2'-O)-methyltransferase [Chloroflexota bacterium]
MPVLYVVATPIGNLEDISLRAIRILRQAKLIAAEDTRKTRRLLNAYDIKTPMTSYHEHNKWAKLGYLLGRLKEEDVAIVSEAGTPGMSDPGYELISAAIQQGIPVVPVPGPSAIVTALAVSGLPTDKFVYLGFPPHRLGDRRRLLESVVDEYGTIVILESPHRLLATLDDILLILGDRKAAVCRELTKVHEEIFRGPISQAGAHFVEPRGEFTLVIEGKKVKSEPRLTEEVEQQLRKMRLSGTAAREAVARIAKETGLSRRELYRTWLSLS